MDTINKKYLMIVAAILWIGVGGSFVAREFVVFRNLIDFTKQFVLLNNFFDTAQSHMNQNWEEEYKELEAFSKRFHKQTEAFHRYTDKKILEGLETLGYDVSDGTVKVKAKVQEPPKKSFTEIQKEWNHDMTACSDKFSANPDAYIKCLKELEKH